MEIDAETLATSIPGVYSGGDCVSGPDTVITAINDGKRAAAAIDRYLGGDGVIVEPLAVERQISGVLLEQETPRQKCGTDGFDAAQAAGRGVALPPLRCGRVDTGEIVT